MSSQSLSEQLYRHAIRFIAPFSSDTGAAWAAVPDGPLTHEAWPLDSAQFREWLANSFFAEHDVFPGHFPLVHAVQLIRARARYDTQQPRRDVFARIGSRGNPHLPDALTIDLANASHEIVEITAHGWRCATNETCSFRPMLGALPLPRPSTLAPGAPLVETLRDLLPLPAPALNRIATWLFAALRPSGPYPILILTGPPAGGKSTTARILRSLIDPNVVPLHALPRSERELFVLSLHHRVLAFEQVPSLTPELSVALVRLASGAAFTRNGQHPFDCPLPFAVERPVILTVPYSEARAAHWNRNRTIASLAMTVQLDGFAEERRKSRHELTRDFEFAAPAILTGLCQAASAALAHAGDAAGVSPSRFVDLYHWITAAAPALGLSRHDVNAALAANPLVTALSDLLAEIGEWTGNATDLLAALNAQGSQDLPANPKALTAALQETPLALYGIHYSARREKTMRRTSLRVTDALKNASPNTRKFVTNSMESAG